MGPRNRLPTERLHRGGSFEGGFLRAILCRRNPAAVGQEPENPGLPVVNGSRTVHVD